MKKLFVFICAFFALVQNVQAVSTSGAVKNCLQPLSWLAISISSAAAKLRQTKIFDFIDNPPHLELPAQKILLSQNQDLINSVLSRYGLSVDETPQQDLLPIIRAYTREDAYTANKNKKRKTERATLALNNLESFLEQVLNAQFRIEEQDRKFVLVDQSTKHQILKLLNFIADQKKKAAENYNAIYHPASVPNSTSSTP